MLGRVAIIGGIMITEEAAQELAEILRQQNTTDRDEPGASIVSDNFRYYIDGDGDAIITSVMCGREWQSVEAPDREPEEDEGKWEEVIKYLDSEDQGREREKEQGEDNGPDAEKLLRDFAASIAAQERRISWANFVMHNPRATEEQRREAAEILDSIPDYDDDEED